MKSFTAKVLIMAIIGAVGVPVPGYAQQVEVDRFFTPERTAWNINTSANLLGSDAQIGFFADYIWLCDNNICSKFDNSKYFNWIVSKFEGSACFQILNISICYSVSGYTIPILRFGRLNFCVTPAGDCFESTLTKVSDNFTYIP